MKYDTHVSAEQSTYYLTRYYCYYFEKCCLWWPIIWPVIIIIILKFAVYDESSLNLFFFPLFVA